MKLSSLARYAIGVIAAGAIFAGCSGNGSTPSSMVPGGTGVGSAKMAPAGHHHVLALSTVPHGLIKPQKFHGRLAPAGAIRGQYVQEFFTTGPNIFGYPKNNSANGPPTCTLSTGSNVNDFGTDQKGNIIIPNAFSGVQVYAPPAVSGQCGTLLGTITDNYGQASSAAALDAVNGTIVVGQIGGGTSTGVVTCTLSSGTCTPLTSPNLASLAGVTMDRNGNCYADGFDINTGTPSLWYYAGCSGTGTELTAANGFSEPYYGGVSADNRGNIVTISLFNSSFTTPSTVTVYSGCSTGTCTAIFGPIALNGEAVFGHLGKQNERWTSPNISTGFVDVWAYTPGGTNMSYLYSFNNGLACFTYLCESSNYGPTSPR